MYDMNIINRKHKHYVKFNTKNVTQFWHNLKIISGNIFSIKLIFVIC